MRTCVKAKPAYCYLCLQFTSEQKKKIEVKECSEEELEDSLLGVEEQVLHLHQSLLISMAPLTTSATVTPASDPL